MLSHKAYEWLALLLELIESGAPWPEDMLKAKATFLAKDPALTENHLAYRVLLILPVLYRRWASARLEQLKPWIKTWQLPGLYAGVEGAGADDAWWNTSLDIESYLASHTAFAGAATDIYKCFDQISRPLLYQLARASGLPS